MVAIQGRERQGGLARIHRPHRVVGVEHQGRPVMGAEFGDGGEPGHEVLFEVGFIPGQLAHALKPRGQAALHLPGGAGFQDVDRTKADERPGPAAHGLEDHFVLPAPEALPAPGKAQDHRGLNSVLLHGGHHLRRPHQPGFGRLVQQAEGRLIGEIIFPVAADFLGKDMGVAVQNHPYTMASKCAKAQALSGAGNLREKLVFLWAGDRRRPVAIFP